MSKSTQKGMFLLGCRCRAGKGFTLVELLVVISIIAILISILLPILKAAREAGKQSVCLSNQRQVGISISMYAMENEDHFHIGPMNLGLVPQKFGWGSYYHDYLAPQSNAYVCPSIEPFGYHSATYQNYGTYRYTYGMIQNLRGPGWPEKRRMSEFQNHSSTMMVVDSVRGVDDVVAGDVQWAEVFTHTLSVYGVTAGAHLRHNSSANVLFMDGHGEPGSMSLLQDFGFIRAYWALN